jgi:hypothetical protein
LRETLSGEHAGHAEHRGADNRKSFHFPPPILLLNKPAQLPASVPQI